MLNRHGIDELNIFLLKVYLCLLLISFFLSYKFISYIMYFVFFIFLFRLLSKNKFDRSRENRIYLDIKNHKFKINNYLSNKKSNKSKNIVINNKIKKNKDYIYKKCNNCQKTLKLPLPKKRGLKSVICPNCKKKMKVLVFRKKGT